MLGIPSLAYDGQLAEGMIFAQQNELGQTEEAYRRAIAIDSKRPEAYRYLSSLLVGQNRIEEALEVSSRGAEHPELAYEAQLIIGDVLASGGNYDDAEVAYQSAIKLEPKSVAGFLRLASLNLKWSKFERAERELSNALEFAPQDADVTWMLAALRQQQKRPEDAASLYRKAAELYKDDPSASCGAYQQLGKVLFELKRFPEAEGALANAIARDPANADAYFNLGRFYEGQHDLERAVTNYSKATELARGTGKRTWGAGECLGGWATLRASPGWLVK